MKHPNYDKNKPFNELPELPPDINFDDVDILKAVNHANKALAGLNYVMFELENPRLLLAPLTAKEAVSSSKIENINTTVADVLQADLKPDDAINLKDQNTAKASIYRDALFHGFTKIKDKEFLNTNSFIEIQEILEPSKPGIRKTQATIEVESTKEVIYTPPLGEDLLRSFLKNYENYFNVKSEEIDPLIRTAILHYQFEAIHPFRDGNGRVGRMLMVLHLVLSDLIQYPILYISDYIDSNRPKYYEVLRMVTEEGDWKSLILFFLSAIKYQAEVTRNAIVGIIELRKGLEKNVRFQKLPHNFVNYLFSTPFYTINKTVNHLTINRKTAKKHLDELVTESILTTFKSGKEIVYVFPAFLKYLE